MNDCAGACLQVISLQVATGLHAWPQVGLNILTWAQVYMPYTPLPAPLKIHVIVVYIALHSYVHGRNAYIYKYK